jgi:hypothetical protein
MIPQAHSYMSREPPPRPRVEQTGSRSARAPASEVLLISALGSFFTGSAYETVTLEAHP